MVLIRLWIPKYCLLDIICLDIYACSCRITHCFVGMWNILSTLKICCIFTLYWESRLIYLYILYLSYSLLAIIISCVEMFAKLSWLSLAWVLLLGLGGQSPFSPSPWMWQQNSSSTHSPKIVKYSQPMWSAKCHWPQNKYLIRHKSRMESGCVQSKQVFPSCLMLHLFTTVNRVKWYDLSFGEMSTWYMGQEDYPGIARTLCPHPNSYILLYLGGW